MSAITDAFNEDGKRIADLERQVRESEAERERLRERIATYDSRAEAVAKMLQDECAVGDVVETMFYAPLREAGAERDRLTRELGDAQAKVNLAEESGVTFYRGENGWGMSMLMSEELAGTLELCGSLQSKLDEAARELAEEKQAREGTRLALESCSKLLAKAREQTARRCAEIASSEQAAVLDGESFATRAAYRSAANRIRILIRREFGLDSARQDAERKGDADGKR